MGRFSIWYTTEIPEAINAMNVVDRMATTTRLTGSTDSTPAASRHSHTTAKMTGPPQAYIIPLRQNCLRNFFIARTSSLIPQSICGKYIPRSRF